MALRDRRGPLATLVLACGYTLVVIEGLLGSAWLLGAQPQLAVSPLLRVMLLLCLTGLVWRLAARFAFTTYEYGFGEGQIGEHTSELQSLMRISYAVFCLKKKKKHQQSHKLQ